MRTTTKKPARIIHLICLLLLVFVTGCYKNIDATIVLSAHPTCFIVKATERTGNIYTGNKPEQFDFNGKAYTVYKDNDIVYTYDEQNRITHELKTYANGSTDISYTYTDTTLSIKTINTKVGDKQEVYTEKIPLNSRGYDSRFSYTDQGHILYSRPYVDSIRVESNNLLYSIFGLSDDKAIVQNTYTYDMNRLSMRNIHQYLGTGNHNLLLNAITSVSNSYYLKTGLVYRVDYFYEFYSDSRVKRMIQIDTKYSNTGWPFEINSGYIGITDFDYVCQ